MNFVLALCYLAYRINIDTLAVNADPRTDLPSGLDKHQ